ncbi:uncharacterized protein yc1106_07675 [Curvularia clavata]|uniref:Uncharacterized protein n=1 Tax=Curvularia clavata TaxID=95742 RepID=A0A9Q8ZE14_CURCL|nr:uncharacterized protein yc1106_07675 [Curvularia clavata]
MTITATKISRSLKPNEPDEESTPSKIRFIAVSSNGAITDEDIVAEIDTVDILDKSVVSWDQLAEVATTFGTSEGFSFIGRLYLSPRQNQRFVITYQGLLNTALKDFGADSIPIYITSPVRNKT